MKLLRFKLKYVKNTPPTQKLKSAPNAPTFSTSENTASFGKLIPPVTLARTTYIKNIQAWSVSEQLALSASPSTDQTVKLQLEEPAASVTSPTWPWGIYLIHLSLRFGEPRNTSRVSKTGRESHCPLEATRRLQFIHSLPVTAGRQVLGLRTGNNSLLHPAPGGTLRVGSPSYRNSLLPTQLCFRDLLLKKRNLGSER